MTKPSRRLNQREVVMGFFVLFIASMFALKTWTMPSFTKASEASQKIQAVKTQISTAEALLTKLQQRSLASVPDSANNSPMKEYVQSSQRLAQVVQHLIADDPHLVTRLINVDHSNQVKDYRDVGFNIEIVGSFPAIGGFIERLENSHLLTQVTSVEISRNGPDLDKCTAKIGVNAHLFTENDND